MAMSLGWSLGPVWYHPTMCSRAVGGKRRRKYKMEGGREGGGEKGRGEEGRGGRKGKKRRENEMEEREGGGRKEGKEGGRQHVSTLRPTI